MYKIASEKLQRAAGRMSLGDLAQGEETQSDEDRRRNLVRRRQQLDADLRAERNPRRRREIGQAMLQLQEQIHAIRPKRKTPGVEGYFMDVCRERMTRAQFAATLDAAVKLMEAEKAQAQPAESEAA